MVKIVKLKELYDLQNGYAFKSTDYVDISNTVNCRMSNIRPNAKFDIKYNIKYLPDKFKEEYKDYLLDDGDLIIAMTDLANDPKILGVPTIVDTQGYIVLLNQRVGKLLNKNKSRIDDRYIKYALRLPQLRGYYKKFASGGLQINISKDQILNFEVPILAYSEQIKVITILDKAQSLVDKRKEQIEACDELMKSLFYEMFGDPGTNPMKWPEGTIRDIVSEVKYGTSKPAVEGGKYKYLRMNNITYNGFLDVSNLKYIDIPDKEIEKCIVRNGDVLFNRTNSKELVGKTCVFDLDEPMVIAGYIIRVRMNEKALPEYLSAILNSKYGKETLYGMCKAIVGQANINAQELQDIRVFIPPIELQKKYVKFTKQVDKLKFEMEQSLKELENNFNSLMQRAFKGESF